MNNLHIFHNRFDEIMAGNKKFRNKRLATLMTDMEQTYEIPMLQSLKYTNKNPEVMHLYREVSKARSFEEVE